MFVLSLPILNMMISILSQIPTLSLTLSPSPHPRVHVLRWPSPSSLDRAQRQQKVTLTVCTLESQVMVSAELAPSGVSGEGPVPSSLSFWRLLAILGAPWLVFVCTPISVQIPLFYKDASHVGSESPTPAWPHINSLHLQ